MATGSTTTWNRGIFIALRSVVHIIAAVQFSFGVYYDFNYVYPAKDHPAYQAVTSFGGKFRYLTILGAVCVWCLNSSIFNNYRFFICFFSHNFYFEFTDLSSNLFHTMRVEWFYWNEWTSSKTAIDSSQSQGFHLCNVCIPAGNECGHFILGNLCHRPWTDSTQIIRIVLPNVRHSNGFTICSIFYWFFTMFQQHFNRWLINFCSFFSVGWIMWCTQMWPFSYFLSYFCHSVNIRIERLVFRVCLFSIWAMSFGFTSSNTSRAVGFIPF